MLVLLPEGVAINNPDMIKMIKVISNTISKQELFLVSIKMDDDSEVTVRQCDSEEEAIALANECTDLINAGPTEFSDTANPAANAAESTDKKSEAAASGDDWDDWDDDDDDW